MTALAVVEVVQQQHRCTIVLSGDIDLACADQVTAVALPAVQAPGVTDVVIDLAAVEFLDSTGIGALVTIRNAALEHGHSIALANVPPRIRDVLSIVGLDHVFDSRAGDPGEISA